MSMFVKFLNTVKQSGMRSAVARALHSIAYRIDRISPERADTSASDDEFINWVRFAVPGMLCPGNIDAMKFTISNMPRGKPVLEIGSFCGLSTVILCHFLDARSPDSLIFTSDKWEFEGQRPGAALGGSASVTHDDYREHVRSTFLRTMETFARHRPPHTIECFSDDFFAGWNSNKTTTDVFGREVTLGGDVGFCYIDGNHTYDFAKRDFENTDRVLVPGGFILFDDSADGSDWEVNRLTREIMGMDRYELVARNPNYLFRKK